MLISVLLLYPRKCKCSSRDIDVPARRLHKGQKTRRRPRLRLMTHLMTRLASTTTTLTQPLCPLPRRFLYFIFIVTCSQGRIHVGGGIRRSPVSCKHPIECVVSALF